MVIERYPLFVFTLAGFAEVRTPKYGYRFMEDGTVGLSSSPRDGNQAEAKNEQVVASYIILSICERFQELLRVVVAKRAIIKNYFMINRGGILLQYEFLCVPIKGI